MDCIRMHATRHERIRELLDIIKRRSLAQYKQFVECVRATNQEHVIRVLESIGGSVILVS